METVKTSIIPLKSKYVGKEDEIDYKAVCFWAATNFFLGDDTHFKGLKCLQPGREYIINDSKICDANK